MGDEIGRKHIEVLDAALQGIGYEEQMLKVLLLASVSTIIYP
jgi:hypothetical protein